MNQNLLSTRPHSTKELSDSIAGDPEVLNLALGEPGYSPPRRLLDAVKRRLDASDGNGVPLIHRYADSRGVASLRREIAAYYQRHYGFSLDPDTRIIVTNGATEALWLSIYTLTNPGDEILIADPTYFLYDRIATSLGRVPVPVPTWVEDGFRLRTESVLPLLSDRTRLLIVNSPCNPTGAVCDRETLGSLVALARERGFHMVHDEVFDAIVFAGEHVPALTFDPEGERVLMVNSFSKRMGMTGWRLGWLVAPADVAVQATRSHMFVSLSTGTLIQESAAEILNDPEVESEVREHIEGLRRKGERFAEALRQVDGLSIPIAPPAGTFYLFVDGTELHHRHVGDRFGPGTWSEQLMRYLLREAKIAAVPGSGFGCRGNGYMRMSFAAPEEVLLQAVERLHRLTGGPA